MGIKFITEELMPIVCPNNWDSSQWVAFNKSGLVKWTDDDHAIVQGQAQATQLKTRRLP